MGAPLRVLFVGCFRYNSGSSHTLLGYARAAQRQHYDLRVSSLGLVDKPVREKIAVADDDWVPDLIVMVFESERFLTSAAVRSLERMVPRSRRLIIDPDGKYSEVVQSGVDTNHPTADSRTFWAELYQQLSGTILQPCLGSITPGVKKFLYFGIDSYRPSFSQERSEKLFDLIYVGNNWYRWHDFVWLFDKLSKIRSKLGRIAVFGKHWFADPEPGFEEHTYSDPSFLYAHGVESYRSVPFGEVERKMGQGKLHPIFVRPVLNLLKLVTPRMFETFAANTVPIIPQYFQHAVSLYGPAVTPLYLREDPADAITTMLNQYPDYMILAREIRDKLIKEHSYDVRLTELLGF